MRASPITMRILFAIGAGALGSPVACGSTGSVADAGAEGAAADGSTHADAAGGVDAAADGSAETGADVAVDAPPETSSDAQPDSPACVRRPFLVDGLTRAGAVRTRSDWGHAEVGAATSLAEPVRRALAAAWLEDGLQEHASIAAFARFTLMALSVGARPEHVAGAQRASLDEIAHARACFALARRYGAGEVGPGELSLEGALGPLSLAELAVLTVHEGCVGETLGVHIAQEQLRGATDPLVCRTLRKIARDELRHAELAWSFVKWALDTGDATVRRDVERAFEEASRASRAVARAGEPEAEGAAEWRAHGRLTGSELRASVEQGLRDVVGPCLRELLGKTSGRLDGHLHA